MKKTNQQTALLFAALLAGTALFAYASPAWIRFAVQGALINGIAGLGVLLLLRAGLLSLGQGLYYAAGAFGVALAGKLQVNDVFFLLIVGAMSGIVTSTFVGMAIARYRGIFFGMLTLAITMMAYGVVSKSPGLGGTDGLNVRPPTFLAYKLDFDDLQVAMFMLTSVLAIVAGTLVTLFHRSTHGKVIDAIREGELRVEYLGISVRASLVTLQIAAGALAGLAGGLVAMTTLHVDAEFAYWTTSVEFVLIVLLGGIANAAAPFASALLLEGIRAAAASALPDYWQLVMGAMMLTTILLVPNGIWILLAGATRMFRSERPEQVSAAELVVKHENREAA